MPAREIYRRVIHSMRRASWDFSNAEFHLIFNSLQKNVFHFSSSPLGRVVLSFSAFVPFFQVDLNRLWRGLAAQHLWRQAEAFRWADMLPSIDSKFNTSNVMHSTIHTCAKHRIQSLFRRPRGQYGLRCYVSSEKLLESHKFSSPSNQKVQPIHIITVQNLYFFPRLGHLILHFFQGTSPKCLRFYPNIIKGNLFNFLLKRFPIFLKKKMVSISIKNHDKLVFWRKVLNEIIKSYCLLPNIRLMELVPFVKLAPFSFDFI